jgi:hypothetical protein
VTRDENITTIRKAASALKAEGGSLLSSDRPPAAMLADGGRAAGVGAIGHRGLRPPRSESSVPEGPAEVSIFKTAGDVYRGVG